MPLVMRRTSPQVANIATVTNNDIRRPGAGTSYHLDPSDVTVTAANGSGVIATSLILVNQIKGVLNFHFADALVLKTVDSANPVATANAVDLASAITLANACKTSYNAHLAQANVHYNNDIANATAAANATDQASLDTLINDIKAKFNLHAATATLAAPSLVPCMIRVVPG